MYIQVSVSGWYLFLSRPSLSVIIQTRETFFPYVTVSWMTGFLNFFSFVFRSTSLFIKTLIQPSTWQLSCWPIFLMLKYFILCLKMNPGGLGLQSITSLKLIKAYPSWQEKLCVLISYTSLVLLLKQIQGFIVNDTYTWENLSSWHLQLVKTWISLCWFQACLHHVHLVFWDSILPVLKE